MDAEQRKNQVRARLYSREFGLGLKEGAAQGCGVGWEACDLETQATELSDSIPCELSVEQAKHARTVLRLGEGDVVEVFNGEGVVGRGEIEVCTKKSLIVGVRRWWREEKAGVKLVVATALPKGSRVDGMIDMLAQVGVDEVWPLVSERSVVDPRKAKLEKLQARAIEGCKQSGRAWLMTVGEQVRTFESLLDEVGEQGVRLMMHFGGVGVNGVKEMLSGELGTGRKNARVVVLIGPEGGWTDEEVEQAEERGWVKWTCGGHTLRIETAAVVGAGVVRAVERACDEAV